MAKLGNFEIHVISERPVYAVNVPEKPTEKGFSIVDHVEKVPTTLEITGVLVGGNPSQTRAKLIAAMQNGEILNYRGRNSFNRSLLVSFDSEHDYTVANGMRFNAAIREIRLAESSYTKAQPVLKTQIKPVTQQGTQQTKNPPGQRFHIIRSGDSFYSIAPKYGTTGAAVVKLNPGLDPKRLQIGQKVRVV